MPPTVVNTTGAGWLEVRVLATDATRAAAELHGEMDLAAADLLAKVLDNQLAAGRRFVRLDLSRLEFLDGAGLDVLINAHDRLLAARGMLTLTGLAPRIARLLRITHLDQALYVADRPGQPSRPRRRSALPPDRTR
jgi:anti-anti-sigma factor